jgi:archaemetzincin
MRLPILLGVAAALGGSRPAVRPPVIAIAPVGEAPEAAVAALAPVLRDALGAEVILVPRLGLPASAFDSRRRQYLSTAILDLLAGEKHQEWERLLGVADEDLYVPRLNFVFGEADSRRGVAVFSLARLRSKDEALFRRRAATEAIHELGHTWGLEHCTKERCVMWFSNTLAESDRKGTRFCRLHASQLAKARGAGSGL